MQRSQNLAWRVVSPFIRFQLAYDMLGTTTKLSMLFQVVGLWLHLKEIFFLSLGLTETEMNIKKYGNKKIKH